MGLAATLYGLLDGTIATTTTSTTMSGTNTSTSTASIRSTEISDGMGGSVVGHVGYDHELLTVSRLLDDPTRASRGGWILAKAEAEASEGDRIPAWRTASSSGSGEKDPLLNARDLKHVYDALIPGYEGQSVLFKLQL